MTLGHLITTTTDETVLTVISTTGVLFTGTGKAVKKNTTVSKLLSDEVTKLDVKDNKLLIKIGD